MTFIVPSIVLSVIFNIPPIVELQMMRVNNTNEDIIGKGGGTLTTSTTMYTG